MSSVGKKDFSEIFTLWDEARLNMIYAKFKRAYGYECLTPDFDSFSEKHGRNCYLKILNFVILYNRCWMRMDCHRIIMM